MKKYEVYMEPEMWDLMQRLSLIHGCKSHPLRGSASEAVRRFAKTAAVKSNKNLANVPGINWGELYV